MPITTEFAVDNVRNISLSAFKQSYMTSSLPLYFLQFRNEVFAQEDIDWLAMSLPKLDVRRIQFIGCRFAPHSLAKVFQALKSNKNLHSLKLLANDFAPDDLMSLVKLIETSPALNNVKLLGKGELLPPTVLQALSKAVSLNQHMSKLSLEDYAIGDAGAKMLSETMKGNHLIELDLCGNQFTTAGKNYLRSLFLFSPHMKEIYAFGWHIPEDDRSHQKNMMVLPSR